MPFAELFKKTYALYAPALRLNDILFLSFPRWRAVEKFLTALSVTAFVFVIVISIVERMEGANSTIFERIHFLIPYISKVFGVFLITLSLRFIFTALEAFRRSYYFTGTALNVSYLVAEIVHHTRDDITLGFVESATGQEVLARAGITTELFQPFFQKVVSRPSSQFLQPAAFMLEKDASVQLEQYVRSIFRQDAMFAQFLLANQITKEEIAGAAAWVERIEQKKRKEEQWWSKEMLGRIEGIAKGFSFGETYLLERYGHAITDDPLYQSAALSMRKEDDEVEAMESALLKRGGANVLLLGPDTMQSTLAVARLAVKINKGVVMPGLEYKQLFRLDPNAIIAAKKDAANTSAEFASVLNQAVRAGNIIVVLENMPSLLASATHIGFDLLGFLRSYLASNAVSIIATAETAAAHKTIEQSSEIMQFFEVVRMHSIDQAAILMVLEQTAQFAEARYGILVTYPALVTIIECAERYFPDGVMPDKAIDLLEEAAPYAIDHHIPILSDILVRELVEAKTGVPQGMGTTKERNNLIALEERLHTRVVGQDDAVKAVARSMRRARSGIANPNRPMGSFLFLGPTGVGKTETAKALAEALFESDEAMHRIDMSEYSGTDGLERLIGSNNNEIVGLLPEMLREKQYGVLLIDEFEKGNAKVHDLFLQIIDEGAFSDARGKKINARNLLIIATSNAAADMIFEMANQGIDPAAQEDKMIETIIARGIYRPELLNRFDGIIVFHALLPVHLKAIARIKLELLAKRLLEKGIALAVTDELVNTAAEKGFDQKFGARPMNRFIQDTIEQVIADKLLRGEIAPGASVVLNPIDLA